MSNIYGEDNNTFAESISTSALRPPSAYSHSGSPSGESGAKGNSPHDPSTVVVTKHGLNGEGKADSCGNHGCND